MKRGGAYDRTVRLLSTVYILTGVVILISTLTRGGGPLSLGVLIGAAFIAIGVGRILIQHRLGGNR